MSTTITNTPKIADPKSFYRKRLIVCCDGTGQSSSTGHQVIPTNVSRLVQALQTSRIHHKHVESGKLNTIDGVEEVPQIVLYQTGIGADGVTRISKTLAQTFGIGVDEHILEAYCFLANNYEPGDELFLFGFSRGAFTARAIASLICNAGLLKKENLGFLPGIYKKYKLRRDNAPSRQAFTDWMIQQGHNSKTHQGLIITLMGVWDTVSSIGLPETWVSSALGFTWLRNKWNEQYGYHDTSLPSPRDEDDWRGYVRRAYQALSLDENRTSFEPILLRFPINEAKDHPDHGPAFLQCWFPGVHTDVGGGYERAYRDISDLSFAWMIDMCWPYLSFKNEKIKETLKLPSVELVDPDELSFFGKLALKLHGPKKGPQETPWGLSDAHDELHTLAFWAGGSTHRKPHQYYLGKTHDSNGEEFMTHEFMHASVRKRMLVDKDGQPSKWRPNALAGFELRWDDKRDQWFWVKEVDVGGKKDKVVIWEWMPHSEACREHTEEFPLLTDDDWQLLRNQEVCRKIQMIPHPWSMNWLWLLLALLALLTVVAVVGYDSRSLSHVMDRARMFLGNLP